jgi:hypothetical protein
MPGNWQREHPSSGIVRRLPSKEPTARGGFSCIRQSHIAEAVGFASNLLTMSVTAPQTAPGCS